MMRAAFHTLLSYWSRHRFQLFALVAGLALATTLWSAVQAINGQARQSYAQAQDFLQQLDGTSLVSPGGSLHLSDYVTLKRQGWKLTPVLEGQYRNAGQSIDLIGIDVLTSPQVARLFPAESLGGDSDFLRGILHEPGGIVLHPETEKLLPSVLKEMQIFRSEAVPLGLAVADISLVSRLLQRPDDLSRLILLGDTGPGAMPSADSGADMRPPDTRALASLPAHIKLAPGGTARMNPGTLTESFHLNLTAFGFLSFIVGLFIVQGTIGLAMEQRRGLLRTLRCLGLPFAQMILILVVEITLIAVASAFIGLILGYFLAASLLPGVAATLSGLYGAEVSGALSLRPAWILSGLAMTLAGASLASAHAFYTLWKLPILQAPSTQARGQRLLQSYTAWAAAGIGLSLGGVLALALVEGLIGGFMFLGGVMLGAALLLPYVLWSLLGMAQARTRAPLMQWLWADARAQLPGLSLALMALMLALATNIGVGTMVSSFRLTFVDWLDQRLAADLYVTTLDDAQGAEVQAWLSQQGLTVLPIRSKEMQHSTGQIKIYGLRDDELYRNNWPMISARPEAWDLLVQGRGVLVSEQLARRADLQLGAHIDLPAGWPSEILGIYADYGNPHGQAMVSLPQLLKNAPDVDNLRFALRLDPTQVKQVINMLQERFEIPRENITQKALAKARSMAVFDQTFLITDALKLLTLAVASFAIFTSLATLWNQRLPQLAPVWAMGVRRRSLALIDILRSLLMAGLTALLALPLGLLLSWALLVVINTAAFGWRLPVYLFPMNWLALVLLALLAAGLAALLPAWRLFRISPSELLKVFSSER